MTEGFVGGVLDVLSTALGGQDAVVMGIALLLLIVLFMILGPEFVSYMLPFVLLIVGWAFLPAGWAYVLLVAGLAYLTFILVWFFFGVRWRF
jgi:hypothetical protein